MSNRMASPFSVCAALLALTLACANPADNKPAAVVHEGAAGQPPAAAGSYANGKDFEFGEGSTIAFVGSKVTGSHDGGFRSFAGKIALIDGRPEKSQVKVLIDTTSLWADNEKLTGHLKSPDFFDVATYPKATFTSTRIEPAGEPDTYTVTGELVLHGVTKSISFPAKIKVEPDRVTTEAEFSVKRFDFNIAYPGKADDLIRDEVLLRLNLIAIPGPGNVDLEDVVG